MRIYFGGNKFIDPIDGSGYRKFLAYGYGKTFRHNALCPGTLSLERHRLLWLYLERETYFLKQKLKVLHVAPEQVFYKKFKQFKCLFRMLSIIEYSNRTTKSNRYRQLMIWKYTNPPIKTHLRYI